MQNETNQHEVIEVGATEGILLKKKYHKRSYSIIENIFFLDNVQFWPVGERPHSYTLIPGVHQHENVIKDNLGFLYFKRKRSEEKV